MKVAMILDSSFPPDPRVENEAVKLIESGHQVSLFCTTRNKEDLAEEEIKGIKVHRKYIDGLTYKSSALSYTFPLYRLLMKSAIINYLKSDSFDVIHVHDLLIAGTVFSVKDKVGVPVVLDLHENRPEIMKHYGFVNSFPGKFLIYPSVWKKKEEYFVSKADKVVVVTELAKQELLSRVDKNKDDIIVVNNTIPENFSESGRIKPEITDKYKDNFVILYIGDTSERRGLKTAIRSLTRIKEVYSNVKLIILGKSSFDSELKNIIDKLQLGEFVDFVGWVDPSEFPSYLEAADVGISPLHKNPHHDTTYANKLFQYMAFGRPIVVSDVLAQEYLVDKYNVGLTHEAENDNDFAEKIIALISNNELRSKLGKNAKNLVKQEFSSEKVFSELIKMYDTLEHGQQN